MISIGEVNEYFPKILYWDIRKIHDDNLLNLVSNFMSIISSFTIYLPKNERGQLKEAFSYSDFLRMLTHITNSQISSYRFIIACPKRTEIKEHTKPDAVGGAHRKLKMPLVLIDELSNINYSWSLKKDKILSIALALTFASLLTAPTRHGGELRQVIAQMLAYLIFKARDDDIKHEIARMLEVLIKDTYGWYSSHIDAIKEPLVSEFKLFAVGLRRVNKCNLERLCHCKLLSCLNSSFAEYLIHLSKYIGDIFCLGDNEYLFGRLRILATNLNSQDVDTVITVATGQWGLAQAYLLHEITKAKELHVLYTQNVLEQRILEEHIRTELKDCKDFKLGLKKVYYYPISATDALIINDVIEGILNKVEKKKVFVLAQGPSMISLTLYKRAKDKGLKTELI